MKGQFIISLDFELYWGVRDKRALADYQQNIEKVWEVIPKMAQLFEAYEIKVTFATVGLLFAENTNQLKQFRPDQKPSYNDKVLSPYDALDNLDDNAQCYFAPALFCTCADPKSPRCRARNSHAHFFSLLLPGKRTNNYSVSART